MSFDAVNFGKARIGLKASQKTGDVVRGYVVAAFENEFDSGLTSRVNGKAIEYVDLKGRSLIGGERKSYSGSLSLKYD